jgi:hypothetical protein
LRRFDTVSKNGYHIGGSSDISHPTHCSVLEPYRGIDKVKRGVFKLVKFLFSLVALLSTLTSLGQDRQAQLIASDRGGREFSLFETKVKLGVTTALRKKSGFRGWLFSPFSMFDQESGLRNLQLDLVKDLTRIGVDSGSVKLLPLVIEGASGPTTVDRQEHTSRKFFGGLKTEIFERNFVEYVVRVNILFPKNITQVDGYEYLGQVTPTLGVGVIENGRSWTELARIDDLDPNMVSLGAVDLSESEAEIGRTISLTGIQKEIRYELGQLLSQKFPTFEEFKNTIFNGDLQLRIYLAFKDNRGRSFGVSFVERADTLEEKKRVLGEVGALGLKRLFDPLYYKRICLKIVSK